MVCLLDQPQPELQHATSPDYFMILMFYVGDYCLALFVLLTFVSHLPSKTDKAWDGKERVINWNDYEDLSSLSVNAPFVFQYYLRPEKSPM